MHVRCWLSHRPQFTEWTREVVKHALCPLLSALILLHIVSFFVSLQEVLDPIKVLNLFKQIKVEVRFLGVIHKTRQFEWSYLGDSSHACISVLAYMCVCVCVFVHAHVCISLFMFVWVWGLLFCCSFCYLFWFCSSLFGDKHALYFSWLKEWGIVQCITSYCDQNMFCIKFAKKLGDVFLWFYYQLLSRNLTLAHGSSASIKFFSGTVTVVAIGPGYCSL